MAVSLEDILLARSQQDEREQESSLPSILGAGIGGTAGITVGELSRRLNPSQQMIMPGSALGKVKPGMRMAGGLVGAILGGALGAGASQMMQQESPAARIMAKLQVDGDLSNSDKQALENILADTYSNTLGM